MLTLREKSKRLTALPALSFSPLTAIIVADATLLGSAAPTNGVAGAVLQPFSDGTAGTQENLGRVSSRLALIKKDLQKVAGFPKVRFSPGSLAMRLAQPIFLAPVTTYPKVLTVAYCNRPKPTPLVPRPRPLALVSASFLWRRV
jgi:hypothetical protein